MTLNFTPSITPSPLDAHTAPGEDNQNPADATNAASTATDTTTDTANATSPATVSVEQPTGTTNATSPTPTSTADDRPACYGEYAGNKPECAGCADNDGCVMEKVRRNPPAAGHPGNEKTSLERRLEAYHDSQLCGIPIPKGVEPATVHDRIVDGIERDDYTVEGVVADRIAEMDDQLVYYDGWWTWLEKCGVWCESDFAALTSVWRTARVMATELRERMDQLHRAAKAATDAKRVEQLMKAKAKLWKQRERVMSKPFMDNVAYIMGPQKHEAGAMYPFDRNHDLIGLQNGYYDGAAETMRPFDKTMMLTKQANVDFVDGMGCPRFDRFMEEISCGDPEWVRFVLQAYATCLFGHIRREELFFFNGGGANGKSVLAKLMAYIAGGYAKKIPTRTLTTKAGENTQNDAIALLKGVRLVWANEIDEGYVWDSDMLKTLASSDTAAGRQLYKSLSTFTPQWHPVITANNRPRVRELTEAVWRRIRLVPFDACFKDNPDLGLYDKLVEEASGIFNRLMAAHAELRRNDWRLELPKRVQRGIEEYRRENDWCGEFLRDETVQGDGGEYEVTMDDLYKRFQEWSEKQGKWTHVSRQTLGTAMKAKGYKNTQWRKRVDGEETFPRGYRGLRLIDHNKFLGAYAETEIISTEE